MGKTAIIRFEHGLGDCVQLTAVINCLKKYRPDLEVDVVAGAGKFSVFQGVSRNAFLFDTEPCLSFYDYKYNLSWKECETPPAGLPATKTVECLRAVFDINPDISDLKYSIVIGSHAKKMASDYASSLPARKGFVAIHYETLESRKNLDKKSVQTIVDWLVESNYVPVILEWNDKEIPTGAYCPGKNHPVWEGRKTGDGEILAALLQMAKAVVAIDSGPLRVAMTTSVKTIAVWTHTVPINRVDPSGNTVHLVPGSRIRGKVFTDHYKFATYHDKTSIIEQLAQTLGEPMPDNSFIVEEAERLLNILPPDEVRKIFKRAGLS